MNSRMLKSVLNRHICCLWTLILPLVSIVSCQCNQDPRIIERNILAPDNPIIETTELDTLLNSITDGNRQETQEMVDSISVQDKNDALEDSDYSNPVTPLTNRTTEKKASESHNGSSIVPPAHNVTARVKVCDWELKDRKAVSLVTPTAVPGSKGIVIVLIKVDNQGKVVFAEVDPASSSVNVKLKEKAREAAKKSVFNQSSNTASPQSGAIRYEFL